MHPAFAADRPYTTFSDFAVPLCSASPSGILVRSHIDPFLPLHDIVKRRVHAINQYIIGYDVHHGKREQCGP
jgi:hypothetical protein